jgi:hypothetical protein
MAKIHRIPTLVIAALALACAPATNTDDAGPHDDDNTHDDAASGHDDAGSDASPLVIAPLACDFDALRELDIEFCEITIKNAGDTDLAIHTFRFSDDTLLAMDASGLFDQTRPGFGSQAIVFVPFLLAPNTATFVRLFANHTGEGELTGALIIGANNVDVTVPLKISGPATPIAVARVKSVNNTPVGDEPTFAPLDDIVLTLEDSYARTPGATITAFEWWIINKPNESSADLTTPAAMTTRLHFNSSGTQHSGLDVAGTFEIGARVTDSNGVVSVNDARVVVQPIPSEALHVQLTWDSPDYDYDLHLIKDAGPWCSENSCYYANCGASSPFVTLPEWDGVAGASAGDPRQDINDLSGYGPENINVDAPVDAIYRIGVHAYSFSVTTEVWATIKVYVNGALAYEDAREMSSGNAFWQPAEVEWSNGAATIYPVGLFQESEWACGM